MSITTIERRASTDEIVAEMDRRGAVIKNLEKERDRLLDALRNIDAVPIDFGHMESAARSMKEIATKAISQ